MDAAFEMLYVGKDLHSSLFYPVCLKYKLTLAELLVLLFLANHREYDTARDIVDRLKLAKSHVSVSVRGLEERGYLRGSYEGHDHRTIHLRLCSPADGAIADAREAQRRFHSILAQGFSEEELETLQEYLRRAADNVNTYLKCSAEAKAE